MENVLPQTYVVTSGFGETLYGLVAAVNSAEAMRYVIGRPGNHLFDERYLGAIRPVLVADLDEARWYEVAPLDLPSGGDVGGDGQVSDSVTRRFARPRHKDGGWAVVTVYWYLTVAGDGTAPQIERQEEKVICRDLRDPGSTEIWSDTEFLTELSFEATEGGLREAARDLDPARDVPWDGRWHF